MLLTALWPQSNLFSRYWILWSVRSRCLQRYMIWKVLAARCRYWPAIWNLYIFLFIIPKKKIMEIYRSRTLYFDIIYNIISLFKLAKLKISNFYNNFILVKNISLQDFARNKIEFIFMPWGWDFAIEGHKVTEFAEICNILDIFFDLYNI
jgi:hypothetical protein